MTTRYLLITIYDWAVIAVSIAFVVDLALGGKATLRIGNRIIDAVIGITSGLRPR